MRLTILRVQKMKKLKCYLKPRIIASGIAEPDRFELQSFTFNYDSEYGQQSNMIELKEVKAKKYHKTVIRKQKSPKPR